MKIFGIPAAALAFGLASGWADAQDRPELRQAAGPPVHDHEHEDEGPRSSPRRPALDGHDHDERFGPARGRPPGPRDQQDPHGRDHGEAGGDDQTYLIRQRADALANELEAALEHLEGDVAPVHGDDRRPDPRLVRLFRQTDAALRGAVQFRDLIDSTAAPQEVYAEFGSLDQQVHGILQAMRSSQDPALRRASSRLAYADEQLHSLVATGAGQPPANLVARQAHVLAAEVAQLERAARLAIAQADGHEGGNHRGDAELVAAIHAFSEAVNHFDQTAETEQDPGHLTQDFEAVDQNWHQVVELANANPHGAFFFRRAERVGALHDEIRRVLGMPGERQTIRFDIEPHAVHVDR